MCADIIDFHRPGHIYKLATCTSFRWDGSHTVTVERRYYYEDNISTEPHHVKSPDVCMTNEKAGSIVEVGWGHFAVLYPRQMSMSI